MVLLSADTVCGRPIVNTAHCGSFGQPNQLSLTLLTFQVFNYLKQIYMEINYSVERFV